MCENYDERGLWHILLSDFVAETMTVKQMQELVHELVPESKKTFGSILAQLKSPKKLFHRFRFNAYKTVNEYRTKGVIYMTLKDLGELHDALEEDGSSNNGRDEN